MLFQLFITKINNCIFSTLGAPILFLLTLLLILFKTEPVLPNVMKISMQVDDSNSLKELQEYIFHIFIQEAIQMKE